MLDLKEIENALIYIVALYFSYIVEDYFISQKMLLNMENTIF